MTTQSYSSIYDVPIMNLDGHHSSLQAYQGRVMLIVNLASHCGFTPQYSELEAMYRDYEKRGFILLGFPCNQFLHQEPGTNDEIQKFAESCYQVTFPIFSKIDVKGANQAALYGYLAKNLKKRPLVFIPWNFSKVLVDIKGNPLKQYLPTTSIKKIRKDIEGLLPVLEL